ncbi:hypothetical protein ZYGR_0AD01520 [Zygosaccharomyces rouxii]|uniref:ZYRO0G09460p n=2 Tax=Zygosaccharomyces rouxii TaxID=4956 RepID=C5E036_ZYGRC|nr:uncharacterized protein ZYRO0G09460g [Zygosaccharomyces rouxii]KAH9202464.1 Tat binding protein 1-interacting [Zygosaccharomyces rouxii]GAV50969.1 hypothetical protein ZYGR_0AD01520 [Zygosaccharomyces rouxii]CAR29470.1 ZYRO0G09460p [Zygosaccharomyces rouxii]
MVKLTSEDAQTLIESYLISQYRPFAINDIVLNLHGQITKAAATKALDSLVQEHRVTAKTFGKVIIYSCNEKELELPAGVESDNFTFAHLAELRKELKELDSDKSAVTEALNKVLKEPSNAQLLHLQVAREQEIAHLQQVLTRLQEDWDPKMEPLINDLVKTDKTLDKELKTRFKIMKNLLAIVKDTVRPTDMGEFLEEIGFEQMG